jgi:hypothetical protein
MHRAALALALALALAGCGTQAELVVAPGPLVALADEISQVTGWPYTVQPGGLTPRPGTVPAASCAEARWHQAPGDWALGQAPELTLTYDPAALAEGRCGTVDSVLRHELIHAFLFVRGHTDAGHYPLPGTVFSAHGSRGKDLRLEPGSALAEWLTSRE